MTAPKKPQDHQSPASDEPELTTIKYGGKSYKVVADVGDLDGDVVDAIEAQRVSTALQAILGPAQWKTFKETKPKGRDYGALFEIFAETAGLVDAGE